MSGWIAIRATLRSWGKMHWQQCFTWCNNQGKQKWLQIITLWLWILHHNSLWPRILHKTAPPRKFCLVRCPPNTLWNLCEVVTKLRDMTLWVHKANKNRNLSPTPKTKPSKHLDSWYEKIQKIESEYNGIHAVKNRLQFHEHNIAH
jgi:hypothetical protein